MQLAGADFGKVGEALGAKGFTVTKEEELASVFTQAKESHGPVVIDVKIANERPLPVEELKLDPKRFSAEEIAAFKAKYQVHDLPALSELYVDSEE